MGKWEMVRLGDVCEKVLTEDPTKYDKIIDYIDISAINADTKEITGHRTIHSTEAPSRARQKVNIGDILVSTVRPNLNAVAIVKAHNNDIIASTGFCVLRTKHNLALNKYVFEITKSTGFVYDMVNQATGASYPAVSDKIIFNHKIPLPPLATQQKIADILDRANALMEKRKAQIEKLDLLVKSQFVEMFGDPVTNPMGWERGKVIDFCDCMVPGRDKPKSFTGNVPWITIDDLIVNGITHKSKNNMGLSTLEMVQVKRKPVPAGSVLMSCVGNLGILSIAGTDVVINQQLHSFQCKDKVINVFIMFELGWQKSYMKKMANSTTLPYMNKSTCNSIPVRVPPLALQTQFANFVECLETQKAQLKKSLALLELNYKSLVQKCFKGEML